MGYDKYADGDDIFSKQYAKTNSVKMFHGNVERKCNVLPNEESIINIPS